MRILLAGIASVVLVTSAIADDVPASTIEHQQVPNGPTAKDEQPSPSVEELLELPPATEEPQVAPPVAVEEDATTIFPDPPSPSSEEFLELPPGTEEPQVAPPVTVEEDPTTIFPDPPLPFPDPPAEQSGPLSSMVQQLSSAARTACAGRDDCLRTAGNFARFLWNNRDKADMQTRAASCLGQSAIKRGYVQAPMDAIRNASTAEMMDLSVEVCECVIGFLGKFGLCRPALVQGKLAPLMSLFNRQ